MLDPSKIQPFDVIEVYYDQFDGEPAGYKYFVAIGHKEKHLVCFKATSKTAMYDNDPTRKAGCVCYEKDECPHFPLKTVVQPDNFFPIPYEYLIKQDNRSRFKIKGGLPKDFKEKVIGAMQANRKLKPVDKKLLFKLMGHEENAS